MPVNPHASSEIGPTAASDDGSPKTPDPTMFPITSAVAIERPSERFSLGRAGLSAVPASRVGLVGMVVDMARASSRRFAAAVRPQHNYRRRSRDSHPRWPAASGGKLRSCTSAAAPMRPAREEEMLP